MVLFQLIIIGSVISAIYVISKVTNRIDYYSNELLTLYTANFNYLYNKVIIIQCMVIDFFFIVLILLYLNWLFLRRLLSYKHLNSNINYLKKGRFVIRKKLINLRIKFVLLQHLMFLPFNFLNTLKFLWYSFLYFFKSTKFFIFFKKYLGLEEPDEILLFLFFFIMCFSLSIFPWVMLFFID